MSDPNVLNLVEEATLAYSLGEVERAASMLDDVTRSSPNCFEAWHALTEVRFSLRDMKAALRAGEQGLRLRPDDLHLNVSLSRVWAELGDKDRAEDYGGKARVLGWQAELDAPEDQAGTTVG